MFNVIPVDWPVAIFVNSCIRSVVGIKKDYYIALVLLLLTFFVTSIFARDVRLWLCCILNFQKTKKKVKEFPKNSAELALNTYRAFASECLYCNLLY
jgi:hypothetical protein